MITIRAYRHSDFETISSWWLEHGEIGPQPGMMVPDGTFVAEVDGNPVASVTIYLTQGSMAYLEGFISRPSLQSTLRRKAGETLFETAYQYAKDQSKIHVLIYAAHEGLVKRYQELGLIKSPTSSLSCLYKEL